MKNKNYIISHYDSFPFHNDGMFGYGAVSSITDKNMWESEGQFTSFVYGGAQSFCVRTLSICLF